MKKIYYSVVALALLSIAFFTGCKKINEGPPPFPPNANGTFNDLTYITPTFPSIANASAMLIAVQAHDQKTVIVTPFQNNYEYGMAQFSSSPGNFSSLINAGSLLVNSIGLTPSSTNSYLSPATNYTIGFTNNVSWQIGGGNGVPAFNYSLNNVFPLFTDSFQNWADNWLPIYQRAMPFVPLPAAPTYPLPNIVPTPTYTPTHADSVTYNLAQVYKTDSASDNVVSTYNKTPQWTVPIKGYVFNADTVFIILNDFNGFFYQTKVAATVDSVAFTPNTFSVSPSSYNVATLTMQVNAVKYRDTVIHGNKFYFLKMGSYIKYYGATK